MKQTKKRHSIGKRKLVQSLKTKWEIKVLHGEYIRNVDIQLIGGEDTLLWPLRGELKGESGSEIIAVQDKALQTKYQWPKILQTETENN
jgi:hypothetical protein